MRLSAMRKRYRIVSHVRFLCFLAIYLIVYLLLCSILGELFVIAFDRLKAFPFEFLFAAGPALFATFFIGCRLHRFV